MNTRDLDSLERRVVVMVAEKTGAEPLTISQEELPAFIAWAVKEFADSMRKEIESGGAPF